MQNFKGDALELKMQSVAKQVFDQTGLALDQFYSDGFECSEFLLMLYDDKRMPFSERIARDSFIKFIGSALANFPFTGTFESYLLVLVAIFGSDSDVQFDVPAPGKLDISIESYDELTFDFLVRELVDGVYEVSTLATFEDDDIVLRGVPGIESEYEMNLLFSEVIPAGIYYTFTLNFKKKFFWISEESSEFFDMIDSDGNQFIFIELGG